MESVKTVVAYLPDMFKGKEKRSLQKSFGATKSRCFCKVGKLVAIHERIESFLKLA